MNNLLSPGVTASEAQLRSIDMKIIAVEKEIVVATTATSTKSAVIGTFMSRSYGYGYGYKPVAGFFARWSESVTTLESINNVVLFILGTISLSFLGLLLQELGRGKVSIFMLIPYIFNLAFHTFVYIFSLVFLLLFDMSDGRINIFGIGLYVQVLSKLFVQ